VGIYRVATGRPLWEKDANRVNVWARPVLAASPDWSLVATGGFVRDVRLWDTHTGDPVGQPLPASAGFVVSAAFDPAGQLLITGGSDGSVRLFDVGSQRQVGTSLPAVGGRWVTAVFGPKGESVLALSGTGRAWSWDISVERLREQACRTANRTLTKAEWRRFVPGRDYAPTCIH
jgi:WD40 repeat protein